MGIQFYPEMWYVAEQVWELIIWILYDAHFLYLLYSNEEFYYRQQVPLDRF